MPVKGKTGVTIYLTDEDRRVVDNFIDWLDSHGYASQVVDNYIDWLGSHGYVLKDGKRPNLTNTILGGFYYALIDCFASPEKGANVTLHDVLQNKDLEKYVMAIKERRSENT